MAQNTLVFHISVSSNFFQQLVNPRSGKLPWLPWRPSPEHSSVRETNCIFIHLPISPPAMLGWGNHLNVFWILSRKTSTKLSDTNKKPQRSHFHQVLVGVLLPDWVRNLCNRGDFCWHEIFLGRASHGFLGLIIQPTICFGHFFSLEINASRFHIPNDNLESSLVTKAFEHHGLPMVLGPCWPGRKRRNVLLRRNGAHKLWFFWYEIVSNLIAVLEKAARIWFLYRNATILR